MTRKQQISVEDFTVDIDMIQAAGPLGSDPYHHHHIHNSATLSADEAAQDEGDDEVDQRDENVSEIDGLKDSLESLKDLHARIKKEGGMNIKLGMEAHKLLPNEFGNLLPQFTKNTSHVRYTASLEALSKTINSITKM